MLSYGCYIIIDSNTVHIYTNKSFAILCNASLIKGEVIITKKKQLRTQFLGHWNSTLFPNYVCTVDLRVSTSCPIRSFLNSLFHLTTTKRKVTCIHLDLFFQSQISEVYSDSDERGVSMSKSASPVISGTASSEDLLQEQGEDQEYTESVAKETAHISSSHPISSSLVVKTLTESSTSKAATPTLSRRALMDSLLTPDTKTTYDKVKAKDLFGDNAPVRILVSIHTYIRSSSNVHLYV